MFYVRRRYMDGDVMVNGPVFSCIDLVFFLILCPSCPEVNTLFPSVELSITEGAAKHGHPVGAGCCGCCCFHRQQPAIQLVSALHVDVVYRYSPIYPMGWDRGPSCRNPCTSFAEEARKVFPDLFCFGRLHACMCPTAGARLSGSESIVMGRLPLPKHFAPRYTNFLLSTC